MQTSQRTYKPITRERWEQIVAQHSEAVGEHFVKRRHPRFPCMAAARVACQGPAAGGTAQVRYCSVLEISAGGLTLRSQAALPVHAPVTIQLDLGDDALLLTGKIMHCTETIGANKVGVQLVFRNLAIGDHPPAR